VALIFQNDFENCIYLMVCNFMNRLFYLSIVICLASCQPKADAIKFAYYDIIRNNTIETNALQTSIILKANQILRLIADDSNVVIDTIELRHFIDSVKVKIDNAIQNVNSVDEVDGKIKYKGKSLAYLTKAKSLYDNDFYIFTRIASTKSSIRINEIKQQFLPKLFALDSLTKEFKQADQDFLDKYGIVYLKSEKVH
jgi:hypothetical protein